jgi:uncharacterized membrane protein YbhN (UPF0104 family)
MSEAPPPRARRYARLVLGLAFSLLLLALLAWKLDLGSVTSALGRADLGLLLAALLVALVSNSVGSAEVLKHVMNAVGAELSRRQALAATLFNLAPQAALPLGTGHASRALYLSRAHPIEPSRAAASVPVLLGVKLCALVLLAVIGFCVDTPALALLGVVALGVGFVLAERAGVRRVRALGRALVAALALTLLQVVLFHLVLHALGAALPFTAALSRVPVCLFVAKIPLGWMGFGTRETGALLAFQGLADPGVVVAGSLLFGVMDQIVPGLVGIFLAPRLLARVVESAPQV